MSVAYSADYWACVKVDMMAVRWVDLLDALTAAHWVAEKDASMVVRSADY